MGREAVAGYIQHRLQVAGGRRDRVLFPPETVDGIHRRTGGVPRLINRVCDRALQLAHERQAEGVDREILDTALIEVGSATLSPTWDAIIFAEPPTPRPAAAPAPPAAHAVEVTPPIDDDENFRKHIDHWVAQDLGPPPPPRPQTPRHRAFADEAPVAPARERRPAPGTVPKTAPRREAPARTVMTDWPRDLRSETYMHRLWRLFAKWAAIALVVFVALGAGMVGASFLAGMLTPPALPALPEAPALAVPGLALPEAPPTGAPVAPASLPGAPSAAVSGEYFVAVGLFASRERADQLVDALTQAGLPAMQRPFQLRRQHVQQIVLGPFFSRSDAVADLRRLQGLGGYDDANVIDVASSQ
jgi:hypothetical protein